MTQDCNSAAGRAVTPAPCRSSAPEAQIKLMKQMQMVIPRRPGFGAVVVSRRATLRLLAIGSIAGCVIITCCVTPVRATDALPVNAPPDKAALAQEQDRQSTRLNSSHL